MKIADLVSSGSKTQIIKYCRPCLLAVWAYCLRVMFGGSVCREKRVLLVHDNQLDVSDYGSGVHQIPSAGNVVMLENAGSGWGLRDLGPGST